MKPKHRLGSGLNAILGTKKEESKEIKSESQNVDKTLNQQSDLSESQKVIKKTKSDSLADSLENNLSEDLKPSLVKVKHKERFTTYLEKEVLRQLKQYCLNNEININIGANQLLKKALSTSY